MSKNFSYSANRQTNRSWCYGYEPSGLAPHLVFNWRACVCIVRFGVAKV